MAYTYNDLSQLFSWTNAGKAVALLLAAHMVQIGLWAYTWPQTLCKAHGLRFDGRPFDSSDAVNSSKVQDGRNFWSLLFAARETGFGLTILILAGMGDWRAVGVVMSLVGALLASSDGVVTGQYGKGGWRDAFTGHFVIGVVLLVLSVSLF